MGSSGGILIFSFEEVVAALPKLRKFFLAEHFPGGKTVRWVFSETKKTYEEVHTSWQDYLKLKKQSEIPLEKIFSFYAPTAKIWRAAENSFLKYDLVMISYGDNIGDPTNRLISFLEDELDIHPIGQEETWT